MVDTCETEEVRKWTSQHVVIEVTTVSLTQIVLSFLSDAERRLHLMRDSVVFGEIDGLDSNCLFESWLQLMLHNKMIKDTLADINVSKWKREACEAVRAHLCSHEDERLRPVRRDQHNRLCDVFGGQHKIAYLEHVNHFASITQLFFNCVGSDDAHVSHSIRVIVHSHFHSVHLLAENREDNCMMICPCESASMPPAEFRLYQYIGKGFAGKQYVQVWS